MCLRTFLPIRRRAKKDIECYKIVKMYRFSPDTYYPVLAFNSFYYLKGVMAENVDITSRFDSILAGFSVHEGYHSFTTLKEAIIIFNENIHYDTRIALVKCIIPKGSYYYKGGYNLSKMKNYVSSNIIVTEEIISGL